MPHVKSRLYRLLRWSEKYTKTDMVYLAKSGFWLQAASVSVSFGSFILYIIFGHTLSKDVYGTYQYLLSIGAIAAAFTMTGMSAAVTRAVARGFEGTYRASIRTQLIWGLIPLLGSWILGAYYLAHGNVTLGWGLVLIGIFTPLTTTFNTFAAYLNAKKDFERGFYYSLFVNIPYYISVALVAVSLHAALALLAANLISQTFGFYLAYRKTLTVYHPEGPTDPEATRYGTHLSFMNFMNAVIAQIDSVLVFHFLGAADLAIYSFATAIPDRLGIFKTIAGAAFPKFATKTHEELRSSLGRKVAVSTAGAFVIALAYTLIAHPFFAIFFPRYMDAVSYSQVYAFIIAIGISPLFTTALTAHGRTKELYVFNLVTPVIQLVLEIIGVLTLGLWGLIYARLATAAFSSLFGFILLRTT